MKSKSGRSRLFLAALIALMFAPVVEAQPAAANSALVTPATVDVAPGEHRLTIEEPGYETVERPITAKYGRAVIVDAPLSRSSRAAGSEPATRGAATLPSKSM